MTRTRRKPLKDNYSGLQKYKFYFSLDLTTFSQMTLKFVEQLNALAVNIVRNFIQV